MAALKPFITFAIMFMHVARTGGCDYQFSNLDDAIFVDWSISVDSVVFTVVVNNVVTKTIDGDVELSMDSTSTNFQLSESDTHQALVKECLVSASAYQLTFTIASDESCTPGILTIITESATPVYNIASSDIFTTIDTAIAESFSDAFIIEISNDQIYGGCGSFSCSTLHLNEGTVQLLYNTANGMFEARRSEIVFAFTYNVEVKCLDKSDLGFVTEDHTIVVNLTFWELTTTSTPTTMSTITSSTFQPSVASSTTSLTQPTTGTTTVTTQTTTTSTTTTPTTTTIATTSTTTSITPTAPKPTTTTIPTTSITTSTTPTTTTTTVTTISTTLTTTTPTPTTTTTTLTTTTPTTPTTISTTVTTTTPTPTMTTTPTTTTPTTPTTTTTTLTTPTTTLTTPTSTKPTTTISTVTIQTTPTATPIHTSTIGVSLTAQTTMSETPTDLSSTLTQSTQPSTQSSLASATIAAAQSPQQGFFSDRKNLISVVIPAAVLACGLLFGIGYFIHRKKKRKSDVQPILIT